MSSGRGEIIVGQAAEKPVAVRQHFQSAGAAHDIAAFDLAADDAHDELAAVHAGVLVDALALGVGKERVISTTTAVFVDFAMSALLKLLSKPMPM